MGWKLTICYWIQGEDCEAKSEVIDKIEGATGLKPRKYQWGRNWDPFKFLKRVSKELPDTHYIHTIDYKDFGNKVHESIFYQGVEINAKSMEKRHPAIEEVREVAVRVAAKGRDEA